MDVAAVTGAYVECALWASVSESGEPLDSLYSLDDFAPETLATMQADCDDFLALIEREGLNVEALDATQLGHDFWLTRNRHGAGFWDRGLGELGDKLTELSHPYGESNLYIGDDGFVYVA